ncbi:pH-response regulator [Russula ochroleuca]|uniref:PH-response regulator n=1 Tax=Russula ochroleuca TaxID=152965 RepID=A0A9P5N3V3_9AGAM|nr:pH-response regulator [Russula ochroleuca]
MSNQLSIPFKRTYAIPLTDTVYSHFRSKNHNVHPEAFKWDLNKWEELRKSVANCSVHVDQIEAILVYHAQLAFILTKLPADVSLDIPYAPAFSPDEIPVSLPNLHFERCCLLFNLASLYSQLGLAEDRTTSDGVKRASAFYQSSAGTLSYLRTSAWHKLKASLSEEDGLPLDLSEAFLSSIESLMLAQAQECVWQWAVMGRSSNGTIAKLAAQVSVLYDNARSAIRDAVIPIWDALPSEWTVHIEVKCLHFSAAAQYRKSIDDTERNKYGHEVARLAFAQSTAKSAFDKARRGASKLVMEDVKSLLEILDSNLTRAQRDNDLIYHQDVPSASSLPIIQPASMVSSIVPPGLLEPRRTLGNNNLIFGELIGLGAQTAIEIYNDRRNTAIKEHIKDRAQQLNDIYAQDLQTLKLPAALDALDKPIGLPPSLLKKAEEVRLENGPERAEKLLEDVQTLARRAQAILAESLDILDQEASEDEQFRRNTPTQRLPSHQANEQLTSKAERYRNILTQAAESDAVIRQRWEEWEKCIVQLTWDEAKLEAAVPSSTVVWPSPRRPAIGETQTHARALRVLLEQLDDLVRERSQLVSRAQRLADADDISTRIVKEAAGLERWAEVQPSMFEDTLDQELAKYDKFRRDIEDSGVRQTDLLENIKARMDSFISSRREDPSVKEREHALQSLDLSYHKYKEIIRHLDEGIQFYNDLSAMLIQFKEICVEWAMGRRSELNSITSSMKNLAIEVDGSMKPTAPLSPRSHVGPVPGNPDSASHSGRLSHSGRRIAPDLPPPDSDQWQVTEMPPPPLPNHRTGKQKKK